MKYILQIFPPNNVYDALVRLESDTPFQAVAVGELIDPRSYSLPDGDPLVISLMRVVSVLHVITQINESAVGRHQINLFTEAVPNEPETLCPAKM